MSGAYADSKVGPPTYADSTAIARACVRAAPERLVWGSDWPHPGVRGTKPDDAVRFELLLEWAPEEAVRRRILAENPAIPRLPEERVRALRCGAGALVTAVASVAISCGLIVGCTATFPPQHHGEVVPQNQAIYVVSGGWHTEIGLPLAALSGRLVALKTDFPSARWLVFGWGAHDYYMAQDPSIGDLLRAAASGPAVMLVIPLQISPEAFFGAANVFALPAPRDGMQRLSEFLWGHLATDDEGPPRRVGAGPYRQSVFFASTGTYNLGHTCNTWTAEALRAAGLPVNATGVVFAGQVLDQLPPILARSNS